MMYQNDVKNQKYIQFVDDCKQAIDKYKQLIDEYKQLTDEYESMNKKLNSDIQEVNDLIKIPQDKIHRLMDDLEVELNKVGITVSKDLKNNVIHVLDSELKFESGEYKIPHKYQTTVQQLGDTLYELLVDQSTNNIIDYIDTIFIEGHTDKVPYNNTNIFGNWGLSTLRAISVWEYIEQDRLSKLKNKDNKPLFSVSGYANTRPNPCSKDGDPTLRTIEACGDFRKIENLSELESNEKNRRIDIRFVPYMDLEQINKLKKK